MRLTERKVCYPQCNEKGNLTKVDYIEIKDKGLAKEKLCQLEDILDGHNIESIEELDGLLWYAKKVKDIEEELGIDLITLYKALKKGIYIKGQKYADYPLVLFRTDYTDNTTKYHVYYCNKEIKIKLKDYGKTWALTKEELLWKV